MISMSKVLCLVGGATLLAVSSLYAQVPAATDAQRAAGARVASVSLEPASLDLMRGESGTVKVLFLDAAGEPVEGTVGLFFARGGLAPRFGELTTEGIRITATEPGDAQLMIMVMVPDSLGNFRGVGGLKQVGMLATTIAEAPAARIEIDDPGYVPYTGTSFKMSGRVFTVLDDVHMTADIRWSSDNPAVATVTSSGVVFPIRPGNVTLVAATENEVEARYELQTVDNPVEQLFIVPSTATARTGDVVMFDVRPLDGSGRLVEGIALAYAVSGLDSAGATIYEDGAFVAEVPGTFQIIASMGEKAATAFVDVTPRPAAASVELVGRGTVSHVATSDLWVFEGKDGRDYAYTGTHANGGGERMFVWDVTDPSNLVLTDSVVVDARVVNDVKVSADASWAIITREGASDRANGIVVLDLSDPAHPTVQGQLTDELTAGIHNVWINGDVVYAVNDGTNAMNILDLSDPANPKHVGRWELRPGETDKSLHDVWSDGRYAYVSYWDDGLVILDVGAGTHGGTPTEPQFVSSIKYGQGNTHVAWREGDYVYLGDEIGTSDGMRGYIHVVDVSDIDHPTEVAKYEVPEAGAHNIWVEDGTLYIAYYQGGLRIVDVSGELRGDLYRQGREIGMIRTTAGEGEGVRINSPMAWGPQPYKGNIFVSDMNSGLWVVKHVKQRVLTQ